MLCGGLDQGTWNQACEKVSLISEELSGLVHHMAMQTFGLALRQEPEQGWA